MLANVKARFTDGVLTPLEPIDLEDGEEVTLHIENGASLDFKLPVTPSLPKAHPPGSETHPIIELIDRLREEMPESDDDILPPDLSKNIDHYLYGAPKEINS